MANDNILSSDIFDISSFVNDIQKNNSDLDDNTLALGMFGYLNDMFTISTQNTIRMTAEYSNEAIATRAKFPKNVITHALNLGIDDIHATPATIKTLILLSEDFVEERLEDNKLRLDSNCKLFIGDYEFHFDYDIIIKRNYLADKTKVYTAMYDMTNPNILSDITNPYLPPVGIIKYYNGKMLAIAVTLRQVEYRKIIRKIIVDNPLENKVMNFDFEDQLAAFDLDVYESDDERVHLYPVYEGLYDETPGLKYCNYSYLNSNNIRVKFNRDSYEPVLNCEVHINIKETRGSKGNFKFVDEVEVTLESETINYNGMSIIIKPIGDQESVGGVDEKSIEHLKKIIPKEALAHGTIINTQDLENFFNQIDDENCKLYFYKNKDNPLTRLYYSYIVTKQGNNVIPTNTVDFAFTKEQFKDVLTTDGNIIMKPGTKMYLKPGDRFMKLVENYDRLSDVDKAKMDREGFLYTNPFLCIINKSPLYTSYILDIFNKVKDLDFTYINQESELQYIASTVNWYRKFNTDRNKYKMDIEVVQNILDINSDMVKYDDEGNIIESNIRPVIVFYDNNGIKPFRWTEADLLSYDRNETLFNYQFVFDTDELNTYDDNNRIKITNMRDVGIVTDKTGNFKKPVSGFNKEKIKAKILIFAKFDKEYGKRNDWDRWFTTHEGKPYFDGYTLTNEYDIRDGLELFYNYTQIMSSDVKLTKFDPNELDEDEKIKSIKSGDTTWYSVLRMPVIRDLYINTPGFTDSEKEKRIMTFIKDIERRRHYIEKCILELEDSFGVDLKFFNTYGPSTLFYLEDGNNINRTNLSMKFKMKPYSLSDVYIKDNIIVDIKEYLEDINSIDDFHAPNLTTYIETKYKDQLIYFEFVDINGYYESNGKYIQGYGPGNQHIYMPRDYEGDIVPEFLNITVNNEDEPDIVIEVITT